MRMLPARFLTTKPMQAKKAAASIKHISAPLKGLSLSSKLTEGDPLTAILLENWIIEENQIRSRPGIGLVMTHAAAKPIEHFIPYYGGLNKLAAATNLELVLLDGTVLKTGFTGNDWHWTSFSNLSANEYTIMVNGRDGVWSWDGGNTSTDPAAVAATSLSKGNPAVITVGAADIGKFHNGDVILVAGATGTGLVNANGYQSIYSVGTPANTFILAGVDTSTAAAAQTSGVTVDPPGTGIIKEVVTAPAYATHILPSEFNIVVSHMNRLWFADKANLAVYYLPLQQKAGMVTELPLNAVFRRGGSIRAMYTWTSDGGAGLDDMLVIFSTNGECVIYKGLDPDSDFNLVGIFRFDSPMSKHCVVNYGGDLYCLISTGLVPMSTLLKAETEKLGLADQNVTSRFQRHANAYPNDGGWTVQLDPNTGHLVCNLPSGSPNNYTQLVRKMSIPIWTQWAHLPSRSWAWINGRMFIGSDDGKVYEMHTSFLNDNGNPITVDLQTSWHSYGSPQIKHFKMVLPYLISDGVPRPFLDFRVDYSTDPPFNQPDATTVNEGTAWDEATWDVDFWAGGTKNWQNWQGIAALGRVGSVRLTASVTNTTIAIAGFDVLYETGGVFG